jgi:hypothetical protein
MAEGAGLILINREIFIEQYEFSDEREFLVRVERACADSLETLRLDLIDPGFKLSYFCLRTS